jgi:hypothetical protein
VFETSVALDCFISAGSLNKEGREAGYMVCPRIGKQAFEMHTPGGGSTVHFLSEGYTQGGANDLRPDQEVHPLTDSHHMSHQWQLTASGWKDKIKPL